MLDCPQFKGISKHVVRVVIFLLMSGLASLSTKAQEVYNNCGSALEVCPGSPITINNFNASASVCANCEDDFAYCFDPEATIWLTFTTNSTGGDVQLDLSNISYQNGVGQDQEIQIVFIAALSPCDASTFSLAGDCIVSGANNVTVNALGLAPNTTYWIALGGDAIGAGITSPAEWEADVLLSGAGVDRPTPSVSIGQSATAACLNDNITFTVSILDCPDNTTFSWFVNGVLESVTVDPFWTATGFSTGDIIRVETDCYSDCPVTVGIDAQPLSIYSFVVDAGVDLVIESGQSAQLSGWTSAPSFNWSPGFEVSNPSVLNPIVAPDETTVFTLTAIVNGCSQSDQVTVFIDAGIIIPNTFSPNGDGINDTWVIQGIEAFPNNRLSIFTRWGQEVLTLSSYSEKKAWDGSSSAGNLAEGVYYYILEVSGAEQESFRGTVNVIR